MQPKSYFLFLDFDHSLCSTVFFHWWRNPGQAIILYCLSFYIKTAKTFYFGKVCDYFCANCIGFFYQNGDVPLEGTCNVDDSSFVFCEWIHISIEVCIYRCTPNSSPWLSVACIPYIIHKNYFVRLHKHIKSTLCNDKFIHASCTGILDYSKISGTNKTRDYWDCLPSTYKLQSYKLRFQ